MTNNTTIDGVSPKRGDRLFHVGNTRACPRGWVEFLCFNGWGEATVRTKNGAVPSVQVDHLQWHAMTDEQQLQEFYSELSNGGKLSKRALCHIRDQQSIIAQLQARIAELESGLGEPVAWLYKNTSIGNQITHQCLDHYWPRPGSSYEHDYIKGEALYTAPPAPVAVELPTTEQFKDAFRATGYVTHEQAWELAEAAEVCLDATAARNEGRK